jgi:glycosyltransferase involved in cell wall biosynthesis
MNHPPYILITPARNEEEHIERVLKSVVAQTVLPSKWVIVSDGSTDNTVAIVQRYVRVYNFIDLVRVRSGENRNFGSKVAAFKAGYARVENTDYAFLGNLDADVSLEPNYYETVLDRFHHNAMLGIAGGIILELVDNRFEPQRSRLDSVAGAIQLFRRRCFEDIGGYLPIVTGGEDSAAEIVARSLGWTVQTFPDFKVFHHRGVSRIETHILRSRYRQGFTHYLLGYRPLFHLIKCVYRLGDKPYVLGSVFVSCGYSWAALRRMKRAIPTYAIEYFRREQRRRLLSVCQNVSVHVVRRLSWRRQRHRGLGGVIKRFRGMARPRNSNPSTRRQLNADTSGSIRRH